MISRFYIHVHMHIDMCMYVHQVQPHACIFAIACSYLGTMRRVVAPPLLNDDIKPKWRKVGLCCSVASSGRKSTYKCTEQ